MSIEKYQTEQFLNDDNFLDWIKNPTSERDLFWQKYFTENPSQLIWADEARSIIEATLLHDFQQVEKYEAIKANLFAKIEADEELQENEIIPLWKMPWVRVAASVVLLLGLSWLYFTLMYTDNVYQTNVNSLKSSHEIVEVFNQNTKNQLILLPDGSIVILQPQSKITYSKTFTGNKREVVLSGEAFFEVERNPKKPFYVHANELTTKVLGTSFVVKAFLKDKHISVEVKSGKVAVYKKSDAKDNQVLNDNDATLGGLILVQHEKIDYDRTETTMIKSLDESINQLSKRTYKGIFDFEDTPISKVFKTIEKEYKVDIIVNEEAIKNCTFNASLTNQHLFDKMAIICATIGARYELVDGKIIVYARGCD